MRGLRELRELREYKIENVFVKAVKKAGGVAYKLTSQTANGLPDRLVLLPLAKCCFVELKSTGRVMRALQIKRGNQLKTLGFPVVCIDRIEQIAPCIKAIQTWTPGTLFPQNIGAKIPELPDTALPMYMQDMSDYGETLEEPPEDIAYPPSSPEADFCAISTDGSGADRSGAE